MMPSLKTQIQLFTRIQQGLIGFVALGLVLFILLVYRPQNARIERLTGQTTQTERQLAANQTQARVLPVVQADINHLRARLADFKKLPASPGDIGEFEIELAELARRNNLTGWSVSIPDTPHRSDEFYELPVSLKFGGDFRDVFAFFCQLEDLSRLTRVKNMTIRAAGTDGSVQVDLLLNLYYSEG
jgi:Tfp pilus assembly protein PilO